MPQTSLLSFLRSSATGTPGSLPALKPSSALPSRRQDDLRGKDVLLERTATKPLPPESPTVVTLSASNGGANARSLVSEKPEEGRRRSADTTGTITKHLSATPFAGCETTFSLPHCPSITITSIQQDHLPALKRLTSTLLPIKYPDTFYADAISDPCAAAISRIALYTPPNTPAFTPAIPIGWIRCSLEPYPEATSHPQDAHPIYNQIYIKALCLLAPYRNIGVAAALLENILREKEVLRRCNVQFIFAHVWESNEEAMEWYEKRGFERDVLVEGYYRRLKPGGAWIVRRAV